MAGQCTYRDVYGPDLPGICIGVIVQAHLQPVVTWPIILTSLRNSLDSAHIAWRTLEHHRDVVLQAHIHRRTFQRPHILPPRPTGSTTVAVAVSSIEGSFLSYNSCKPQRLGRHPSCAVSWAPTSRVHSCPALWQLVQLGALCVIDRLGIRYIHWLLSPSIFYRTASWAGHITSRIGIEYVSSPGRTGPLIPR